MAVIAVSRQMGAWGDEIAGDAARSLGYSYVDRENIYGEAERLGLQRGDLEKLDEKKPSLRDRIFRDRISLYKRLLRSIIFQFAKNGNSVLVGGGACLILKDLPGILRVKVVAPEAIRIGRVAEQLGLSSDEAASLVHSSDNNRAGFIKHLFEADWMDAVKYDLVLNTGHVAREEAARLIEGIATSDRMQWESEEALGLMQKLALARKVDAMLFTDKRVEARYVTVIVEDPGVVTLKGMVNSEDEKQMAESLAMSLEETEKVVNEVLVSVIPVTQTEPM